MRGSPEVTLSLVLALGAKVFES